MDLASALELAASAEPSQRQQGNTLLAEAEKFSEFHLELLRIYTRSEVQQSSRYLALIYFKNSVDRKWKQPAAFTADVKQKLRTELLSLLGNPLTMESAQMTRQLAVIIASIGRLDFPRAWPDLLNALKAMILEQAQTGNTSALGTTLEVMHQTLKRLSTIRIGLGRVQLSEFAVESVLLFWELFKSFMSYTALKIVGTLLYAGHERAHRFEQVRQVFSELLPALQSCNELKYVLRIGKIYERLLERYPLVFCGFGEAAKAVTQFYTESLVNQISDGPVVQAMIIVRDLTRLIKTQTRQEINMPLNLRPRDDTDRQELQQNVALISEAFSPQIVAQLVESLVEHYFQMSREDAELWQDDPEEFVLEEQRQNPEFNVQLCAEMLFAHVLRAWPESVAPQALTLVENAVKSEAELKVEGALRVLQFGAISFAQSFSIEPVVHHLANTVSPIIRRRLCLMLGGWIPVKNSTELQTLAFGFVQDILCGSWDVVVQLGALELVRIACDDLDFQPELFNPVSEAVFATCYRLLQANSGTEIKISVLHVLSTVVEGLGARIHDDDIHKILTILPALWETETENSNHHLVQSAILQTLTNLVNACGSIKSAQSYHVAIPLVQVASDPTQPLATYLMDDVLALWKALLVNALTSDEFASLFDRIVDLLESRTEYLGIILSIIESYLWLDMRLAKPHYTRLFSLFALYLDDGCAMDEALQILLCLEVLLLGAEGPPESKSLTETGLMRWMETRIQQSGGEQVILDVSIQANKCLNVISLVSSKTQGTGVPNGPELCPVWLSNVFSISDPRDRKLVCMGATALLLPHPELFDQYSSLFIDTWAAVVDEIPDTAGFTLFYSTDDEGLNAEESRQRAARQQEVAVVVGMQAFVREVALHAQQQNNPRVMELSQRAGIF